MNWCVFIKAVKFLFWLVRCKGLWMLLGMFLLAKKNIKAKVLELRKGKQELLSREYENFQRYLHGDKAVPLYSTKYSSQCSLNAMTRMEPTDLGRGECQFPSFLLISRAWWGRTILLEGQTARPSSLREELFPAVEEELWWSWRIQTHRAAYSLLEPEAPILLRRRD